MTRNARIGDVRFRNRRGAIVVMTGIFIVAIMLIAAISVDASRIFVAKNELQTAADAAALAGAAQLLEDSSTAADTALNYARRNRVEQHVIDSVEITHGVWKPIDRVFIAGAEPRDAMLVTTRHPLPLSLARVFGDTAVTISSSAVAWSSGPIAESQCAKPLAMPYGELLVKLGYPYWADIDLSDDDIRNLREMSETERSTHFHYADPTIGNGPDSHYELAQYFPIDIDSTWNAADPATNDRPAVEPDAFQSYVVGPLAGRCSRAVSPNDALRSEPGDKRQALRDGLSQICQSRGGTLTGSPIMICRSSDGGSSIALPLKVIFWAGDGPNWDESGGRALLLARMSGMFVVTEFKWEPTDSSGTGQHARMAGYWSVGRDFGPVRSAGASTLVRPILVR